MPRGYDLRHHNSEASYQFYGRFYGLQIINQFCHAAIFIGFAVLFEEFINGRLVNGWGTEYPCTC